MATQAGIDFLEEVHQQAKANVFLFAGPLALVFAQLRTIFAIDMLALKVVVSAACFSLIFGLYKSYRMRELVSFLLIKEKFKIQNPDAAIGASYVEWSEKVYAEGGVPLEEDKAIAYAISSSPKMIASLIAGYALLLIALVIVIWSSAP